MHGTAQYGTAEHRPPDSPVPSDAPGQEKILSEQEIKISTKYNWKLKDKEYGHQDAIANILHEKTPYRGLLIFHELGSGKTPTSIKIVQNNPSRKAWIITKAALSGKKSFIAALKSIKTNKFNNNFN